MKPCAVPRKHSRKEQSTVEVEAQENTDAKKARHTLTMGSL
jgi:hypothetical protein